MYLKRIVFLLKVIIKFTCHPISKHSNMYGDLSYLDNHGIGHSVPQAPLTCDETNKIKKKDIFIRLNQCPVNKLCLERVRRNTSW